MARGHSHHILFPRKLWRAQDPTKFLRENMWLQPPLDIDVHNELHRAVTIVPVPPYPMAVAIKKYFIPEQRFGVKNLELLAASVARYSNLPGTPRLEHSLGLLIVEAILGQRDFISEGLIVRTVKPSLPPPPYGS